MHKADLSLNFSSRERQGMLMLPGQLNRFWRCHRAAHRTGGAINLQLNALSVWCFVSG